MLRLALTFLIVALIAGLLGLPGVEMVSLDISRVLFFLFLVMALVFFVFNLMRGSAPRDIV